MVKVQSSKFPTASSAQHLTVVVPKGNAEPAGGKQLVVPDGELVSGGKHVTKSAPGQLSVTIGLA